MMNSIIFVVVASLLLLHCTNIRASVILNSNGEALLHYGFKTDNGQTRTEDIKYNQTKPENTSTASSSSKETDNKSAKDDYRPVEYRGGYSFISADGYEYSVLYKANKNGFQPYVTAHKITTDAT